MVKQAVTLFYVLIYFLSDQVVGWWNIVKLTFLVPKER
jgi:hypothetical protein